MEEVTKYLRALVLIQLAKMEVDAQKGKAPAVKAELVLSKAGFEYQEIASLLGKSYAAVAKAVNRAKRAGAQGEGEANGGEG